MTRKSAQERRKQIADAAIKVIGERGLREFTAAQLARGVGITDATIFRHFKDMNEVKLAALDRIHDLMDASPGPVSSNPLTRLEQFIRRRLDFVAVRPDIPSVIFSDQIAHALGDAGPLRIAALRNRGRELVTSCLRDAAQQGLIRSDIDIEATAILITGMVMGVLFAAKDEALTAPITEMGERCWRTLESMLQPAQVTP